MEKQRYWLSSDVVRDKVCWQVRSAPQGWIVEIRPPARSLEQNAHLWSVLTEISEQVDWYGQKLSKEDWKDVLTVSLRKSRVVPGIDPGSYVVTGLHTSKMTVKELSALLELAYAFGAEHGVVFKEPRYEAYERSSAS